jgi:hypothetical protein
MQRVVRRVAQLGVILVVFLCRVATAQSCTLYYFTTEAHVEPPQPRADRPVTVTFVALGTNYYSTEATVNGQRIDIFLVDHYTPPTPGQYPPPQCPPLCGPVEPVPFYPAPSCSLFGKTFDSLAPGTYEVYLGSNHVASFVVAPTPVVPALHPAALLILGVLLAATGAIVIRC